jgi:putative ABC transport system ATP-binding protein
MISAKNIKRTYETGKLKVDVLKGINLVVEKGEFIAIMGRSGAGKSTLLYQLSLLDTPSEGSITIDGIETTKLSISERIDMRLAMFGYVFQEYAILPELTAVENVMIPSMMRGLSKKGAYDEAKNVLEEMGLGDRLQNRPSQLSGGEQQRVSIARAIAHKPKILFADEPTANLDSVTAKKIMDLIASLNKKGQTIVMVTHEKEYGKKAHRLLTMNDGLLAH